jgi:signal transduction histidine kinase/ligand-binding sensor domain-containing protein/CheY-like chemotaxis protein
MGAYVARTLAIASFAMSGITVSGVTRLPVVTRHDIRFINLAVGGEPFRKWVMAIAQDSRGFIWLGTNDGLYRYDGYAVKSYRHDPNDSRTIGDNTIKVLLKDRAGILWIGTGYAGLDRFDPEREAFTHYPHDPNNGRSLRGQTVTSIYQDRTGALWVGSQGGLDRLDPTRNQFVHYEFDARDRTGHDEISALYEDPAGGFWAGTPHGLFRLDQRSGHLSPFRDESDSGRGRRPDYVNSIVADSAGTMWVGMPMGNGLSTLDPKSGTLADYSFNGEEPGSPRLAGVNTIREDRNGTLWVGTLGDGLLRFDRAKRSFDRYFTQTTDSSNFETIETLFEDTEGDMWVGTSHGVTRFRTSPPPSVNYQNEAGNPDTLRNNTVWAVHADKYGFLWIGTAGGLHRLDRKTGAMAVYRHDSRRANSLSNDTVSAIAEDDSGGLWIGTHGGGVNHFDRFSERFTHYRHDPNNANSLSDDLVQCLLVDAHDVLWVGTHNGGLNRLDPRTRAFTSYRNDPGDSRSLSEDNVRVISRDRSGALWIGTNHGLDRLDPDSRRFTVYLHDPHDPTTISHNSVGTIFEDHQGILWVGTRSGLNRLDRASGKFAAFTVQDGLADDAVESVQEDKYGHLWLATHQGISEFQTLAKVVRNYSEADGLPGNFENPNGTDRSCKTPSGEIVFGSAYGATVFDPERVSKSQNTFKPPVVLTNLLLFNRTVLPGANSVLVQPIWATSAVTLNHKQSIFTIEFAALSYAAPERNRYRYKLDNLEKDWNEVDSKRRLATYTSLPPGKYVFRVQASNNDLVWNQEGTALKITVLPPWWASWQFRSLFGLILVAAILAAHRMRVRQLRRTAARLELEVRERTSDLEAAKESAENANRAKSAFLAHMSHELRTPLNAVLGFATLLRDEGVTPEQRNKLDIIQRSGEHLLTLINDVLDIAKIEAGKEQLELAPCDLIALVRDVAEMMRVRAEANKLDLRCIQPADFPQHVMADAPKLRQVLINLLGNAVKFTPTGTVTLRMSADQRGDGRVQVRFEVEDTGPGIPNEDQQRVFEPFVQLGQSRQKGTGLGLTITRRFVEIMGGTIAVESSPGGSLFAVEVPCTAVGGSGGTDAPVEEHYKLEPGQPECRVLIVEDDPVNAAVLEETLSRAGFSARVANEGAAGVKAFEEWHPRFVWMDVRMPGMSGVEATRRIREMPGGKEVRIAALTASAFESERDQVLSAGMDDFLRKPFRLHEVFDCMSRNLGLRYCRVDPVGQRDGANPVVGSARVTVLPDELRQELRDALLLLNRDRINAVIERIAEQDASIASELRKMAERLAYTEMLRGMTGSSAKPA